MDLAAGCDYGYDLDVGEIFHSWEHDKDADILSYRDKSFASKVNHSAKFGINSFFFILICSIALLVYWHQVSNPPLDIYGCIG